MASRFVGDARRVASVLRPVDPVLIMDAAAARAAARAAVAAFPGRVAYAVKANDRPDVLRALHEGGVRDWDVASIAEVRAVAALFPGDRMHYMNPVKPESHVAEAYALGVRSFAYDCADELGKVRRATGGAPDVVPVLRLAVSNEHAALGLSGKFGCPEDEAPALLRAAAACGWATGVTFHVGSQCRSAAAYADATWAACRAALAAGVPPALIDIGGGFPAPYVGDEPEFAACAAAARRRLDAVMPGFTGGFQCEPGRLLSAPAAGVLVRVELRKGDALHLNDGVYGLLGELKCLPGQHPARLVRPDAPHSRALAPFALYGPTCDSVDAMPGPYMLPDDVREGDWIEFGLMGAYSSVMRTAFNGMGGHDVVEAPATVRLAA